MEWSVNITINQSSGAPVMYFFGPGKVMFHIDAGTYQIRTTDRGWIIANTPLTVGGSAIHGMNEHVLGLKDRGELSTFTVGSVRWLVTSHDRELLRSALLFECYACRKHLSASTECQRCYRLSCVKHISPAWAGSICESCRIEGVAIRDAQREIEESQTESGNGLDSGV